VRNLPYLMALSLKALLVLKAIFSQNPIISLTLNRLKTRESNWITGNLCNSVFKITKTGHYHLNNIKLKTGVL